MTVVVVAAFVTLGVVVVVVVVVVSEWAAFGRTGCGSLGLQRFSRLRRPITGREAAGAVLIVRLSAESLLAFAATDFHRRVSARTSRGGTIASSCVCVAFTPRR